MALRLRKVVTAQQSLPIVDIRDDTIVLTDDGLRQVLDCQPTPVSLRDDEEQAAVQEAWAELLHSITHPLQIVIDSWPAHEGDLRSLRSGEVSAALAGIAASYDRLLVDLTASSEVVRRTFYVVVPLDASTVMRRRNATEQSAEVARLHERTQTIAQQLDRAGVKSRVLSTGELVEALYSQLNSDLARRQPLVPKDLVANRVRDLIAPSAFERTRDAFTVDQRATQTLAIVGYPRFLHMDWLQVFLRLRSAARIGLFISPVPTEFALPYLEKKIAELASSLRLGAERGRLDAERQAALDDARALQSRLVRSEERFFDVAVYATVEAENRQPLEPEVARLETALGGLMLKSRRVHFQMDQGYWSTFPIASDRLGIRRSLTTAGLRVTFPFSASNFSQPNGILYGLEPASGAPVFLDRFALPNANAVSSRATSGSRGWRFSASRVAYTATSKKRSSDRTSRACRARASSSAACRSASRRPRSALSRRLEASSAIFFSRKGKASSVGTGEMKSPIRAADRSRRKTWSQSMCRKRG